MNETMIKNINCLVREDDVLFHLGDWSFGGYDNISEFRQQIRCKNIHLLLGNHDHHIERNAGGIQRLFNSVHNYLKVEIVIPNQPSSENQRTQIRKTFVLCHYPIASWHDMNRGVIHLHGHVHLSDEHKLHAGKAMDVGMDGNSMNPYSLQEISQIMRDRPVRCIELPNDHHETNGGQ
jgi:calcineurin-like phosphoesterase family protein